MTEPSPAAIAAAERAARSILNGLITDLDTEIREDGCYTADTLRKALTIAGREAAEAAWPHQPAPAGRCTVTLTRACPDTVYAVTIRCRLSEDHPGHLHRGRAVWPETGDVWWDGRGQQRAPETGNG